MYHEQNEMVNNRSVIEGVEDEFVCAGAFLAGHDLKGLRSRSIEEMFEEYPGKCFRCKLKEKEKMLSDYFKRRFAYGE